MGKITPQILVTFITIHKNKGATIHDQLYEQLKTGVYNGMLRSGERMPSSREMSTEFKISRNAVLQVFEQLTIEGFFEAKTGAGTFISKNVDKFSWSKSKTTAPEQKPERFTARPYGLNDAFKGHVSSLELIHPFQASVPLISEFPFQTWARISAAVHKKMNKLHLGYDDAQGYWPLRKALCDHLRISRSVNCDPDNMLIVNGSRQALNLIAEILLNDGDQCWMEDPGYPGATSAIKRFGGQICPVPIIDDGMDLNFASHHYPKAKLAYVTPSHQFPMGNTMALSERVKLLNWAKDHDMWIVEDDYDSEFRYNSRPIPALQGMDTNGNVIYVGNLSKVILPALRLGYMVFPTKAMARQFTIAKSVIEGQSNIINQAIINEFIRQGHFSRHIRRMRVLYKKAQDDLVNLIRLHLNNRLQPVPVEAGMHFIAWLPPGVNATIIANDALKEGLIIQTLNQYSVQFNNQNGLILGFAGFSFMEMETAILVLKRVLDKHF
ncbi:PLP-dependent aminotransferase family protein [Mucilaginibacter sp. X4EP1]|uniref:MocR-like pyridoxine biosynthesis transcription factor PdxR n=1 Tax=Mucilaginibacter sp. X4EP1 TaxID=2723092 RepID=UPI0021680E00|nr:PLP-dependent aminotransferase family protein [Mucilaginibacter sp. X4EP1]MCS3813347.1 GntR family transcriptional regulator/MocR family aminotransferase [Mucilaginibacter sp. X4EP1]